MELKGELRHFPLAEVALLLEAMSQTGALRITPPEVGANELVLHFVEGLVTVVDDGKDRSSTRPTIRQRLRMRSPLVGRFDFEPRSTGPEPAASPGLSSRDLAALAESIDGDRGIDLEATAFRLLADLPVGRQILKIDRGGWSQLTALVSHDTLSAVVVASGTDAATVLDWCQTFSSAGLGELISRAGTATATESAPPAAASVASPGVVGSASPARHDSEADAVAARGGSGRHLQSGPDPVDAPVPAPKAAPSPPTRVPDLVPAGRFEPVASYGQKADEAIASLRKELAATPGGVQDLGTSISTPTAAPISAFREAARKPRSTHSRRAPVSSGFLTRLIAAVRAS